jgi:hypothetical protein
VAGKTGVSGSFTVGAGALNSFTAPTPATQTAGTSFNETITAIDSFGNAASGWTSGTACVTFSGPSSSPNATVPLYPVPTASCTTGQSGLSFNSSAQATAAITLYDAQSTTFTVTSVTAPAGKTGTSGSFTVSNKNAINSFSLSPSTSTPTAGTAFTVSLTALDQYGNTDTNYTGTECVTFSGPASSPNATAPLYPAKASCSTGSSSLTFASGVATAGNAASITLYDAQSVTLTATDNTSSKTGTTGLTVGAAAPHAIAVSTGSGQSARINTAFTNPLVALVTDSFGNPVSGATVTFTPPGSGASGTFAAGANTAVTNSSGLATSVTFTANATTGGYNVSASATGAGSVNFSETNAAGIAFVEQAIAGSGPATSETPTLGTTPTNGDTEILTVGDDGNGGIKVSTVVGGGVTTWNTVQQINGGGTPDSGEAEIWYGLVTCSPCTGSNDAVTVTMTATTNIQLANVSEWSGIATSSPVDSSISSVGTASGTTFTSGPISLSQTGDLVISDAWLESGFGLSGTTQPAPPSGYTGLTETKAGGTFWRGLAAYQIGSSSPVSATWTEGTANGYYATAIAAFKP